MERTGKYEKFPVLEAGDVVVCGMHTAYLVTGEGCYGFLPTSSNSFWAKLWSYADCVERLFDNCDSCRLPEYTPEAVFRPSSGYVIPVDIISNMIEDWRSANAGNDERFSRIWSIDDDNSKELTVDEVSKLLGYKVKIVGSDE
jgi:hypothetical protein